MNRTAKCIRMLTLLRANRLVSTKELAQALETNPRNIREFRKELEEAGYSIRIVRGTYGGYSLDTSTTLPLPALNRKQAQALRQTRDYIAAHPGLPFCEDALPALNSVLSQINRNGFEDDSIYFLVQDGQHQRLSKADQRLLRLIRKAMEDGMSLELSYLSKNGSTPKLRLVDPYELICQDTVWYLCGYDHSHDAFRTYRISSHRMLELHETFDRFVKDPTFRLQDHIGTNTLIKSEIEHYLIQVKSDQARFVEELYWGEDFKKQEEKDGYCTYSFYSPNAQYVLNLLTRFGPGVRLLEPKSRVSEYVEKLKEILLNYD